MSSTSEYQPIAPARPLWDGIYDFAWRITSARELFTCSFCMTILAFCACGFRWLVGDIMEQVGEGGLWAPGFGAAVQGGARIFMALAVISFLCSLFPGACFIRIIESTAAGEDHVRWYQGAWFDFLKDLAFLVWILFFSAGPPGIVLAIARKTAPLPALLWWVILVGGTLILFPFFLLSTMMANVPWMLVHYRVLTRFFENPLLPAVLYLNTFFLGIPCVILGYWMATEHFSWFLFTGIVWATYWMVYARLLGRMGWILTEEKRPGQKRKKQRPAFDEE
jgi:hypothetical protein